MIKILQYGEGNFLRSFADLHFQTLNEEDGEYEVHIVTPIPGDLSRFKAQNNRYHVILRGMEDGEAVEKPYEVTAVKQVIDPFADPDAYYALARDPELHIIVSNTTEAGICYRDTDTPDELLNMTYPAKLTLFLYERFKAGLGGLHLLPVELIDYNADNLSRCVAAYIDLWKLPEEFRLWMTQKNSWNWELPDWVQAVLLRS